MIRSLFWAISLAGTPFAALAADPSAGGATINLAPLLDQVVWPTLVALGLVLGTWLVQRLAKRLGIQNTAALQNTMEAAMTNGLQLAQAKVATLNIEDIRVQHQIIADAVNYAIASAPAAAKGLGLDKDALAERLSARLAPAVLAAAATEGRVSVGAAATVVNPAVQNAPVAIAAAPLPVQLSQPPPSRDD